MSKYYKIEANFIDPVEVGDLVQEKEYFSKQKTREFYKVTRITKKYTVLDDRIKVFPTDRTGHLRAYVKPTFPDKLNIYPIGQWFLTELGELCIMTENNSYVRVKDGCKFVKAYRNLNSKKVEVEIKYEG